VSPLLARQHVARDIEAFVQDIGLRLRDRAELNGHDEAAPDCHERLRLARLRRDVPGLQLLHVLSAPEEVGNVGEVPRGQVAGGVEVHGHGFGLQLRDHAQLGALADAALNHGERFVLAEIRHRQEVAVPQHPVVPPAGQEVSDGSGQAGEGRGSERGEERDDEEQGAKGGGRHSCLPVCFSTRECKKGSGVEKKIDFFC
jgi:hypothetical protein